MSDQLNRQRLSPSHEKLAENSVLVQDAHLKGAEYLAVYLGHAPGVQVQTSEIGDPKKMRVLGIELYRPIPLMHTNRVAAEEAYRYLEPTDPRHGSVWLDQVLAVARERKARCFFTDMYLPPALIRRELREHQGRVDADTQRVYMALMAGAVAAAANGTITTWINGLFKSIEQLENITVSRRKVVTGIGAATAAVAAFFLPAPVMDATLPDPFKNGGRISERDFVRSLNRVARGVEEKLDPIRAASMLSFVVLRNFCFALKARHAVRLRMQDEKEGPPVRAVMPVGAGHFGMEEAFKLSDEQIIRAMEELATRLNLDQPAINSMYSLAEVTPVVRGEARATIHQLPVTRSLPR